VSRSDGFIVAPIVAEEQRIDHILYSFPEALISRLASDHIGREGCADLGGIPTQDLGSLPVRDIVGVGTRAA